MLRDDCNDKPDDIDDEELVIISHPDLHFQLIGPEDLCRSLTGSNSEIIETLLRINDVNVYLHAATNYDMCILNKSSFKLSQLLGLNSNANLALFIFDMNNKNTLTDSKCALAAYVLESPHIHPILVGVYAGTTKTQRIINQNDIDLVRVETKQEVVIVNYDDSWMELIKTLVTNLQKKQAEELQASLTTSSKFEFSKKNGKIFRRFKTKMEQQYTLIF